MPQMAPMNWFIMFITFVFIFLTTINKIFYISSTSSTNFENHQKISTNSNLNLWKW